MKSMRTMLLALAAAAAAGSCTLSLAAAASGGAPLSLAALLSPLDQFPLPAAPPRPFLCLNAGSYTRHLPLAMVGDGVCDCCDGSDENLKGGNPWFEAKDAATAAAKQPAVAATGGWLNSLLGSDSASKPSAAASAQQGPCPNTCLEHGAAFLSAFEARIVVYAAGVALKSQRMKDAPKVQRAIAAELASVNDMFEQAVDSYREAHALHNDPSVGQNRASYEALMEAQHVASSFQAQVDQLRWMQGQPVAAPGSRPNAAGERPMRAAGNFGPKREWLLWFDQCLPAFEWAQRRWGHFGESVDWYRMQLCPLQNATQQAMQAPTPKPAVPSAAATTVKAGEADSETSADASSPAQPLAAAAAAAAREEGTEEEEDEDAAAAEEEAPTFVLGWWTGEIVEISDAARMLTAADTTGALSAASASVAAPTSRSPPPAAPAPGAWGAPPPGSVLAATPEPRFQLSLRGGDNCWQVGARQAEIEVLCGGGGGGGAGSDTDTAAAAGSGAAATGSSSGDRILRIEEDGKCRYRFVISSSLACSAEHLALMQTQLRDYRSWFGRRAPPPAAARSVEEHWAKHDEL